MEKKYGGWLTDEVYLELNTTLSKRRWMLVCILLYLVSTATQSDNSFGKFWGLITYNANYQKFYYMLEPQIRLVYRNEPYEQFMLNAGGGIDIASKLQLWLGQTISNFSPYNNVTEDVASNDLNEYRLWQQLLWTDIYSTGSVVFRSRLEERKSFNDTLWAARFRERGYWTIQFTNYQSLVLSDEFFINVKTVPWIVTKTFDQNRAYIGILQKMTPTTSFSISYMNQYLSRTPVEINHAVVLNIFVNVAS